MSFFLRVLLLLFVCCGVAFSAESFVVQRIDVAGRKYTKAWVIERELQFAVGDTVDDKVLEAARKRLLSLGVFNDVTISDDSTGTVALTISEPWPILPLLGVELAEGQFSELFTDPREFYKKVVIHAGISDYNFRGNGGSLYGIAQLGAAQGFAVSYQTRWFSPRFPYAVRYGYRNLRIGDRHASVLDSSRHLRDIRAYFQVATRVGAPSRIGLELRHEEVSPEEVYANEAKKVWRSFWFTPFVVLDRRDLEWYPSRGARAEVRTDLAFGTEDFVRSFADLRGYFPLSDATRPSVLALRLQGATSTSSTPVWAHFYHGFDEGFRGYRADKTESSGFLVGDAALRVPLTRESFYDVPLLGKYGRHWPFGIFSEWFMQGGELQIDKSRTPMFAGGTGLLFRFPYVQFVEFAYTVNRDGQTSLDLSLGIPF
jgi:outer membrane protein assembly factor BamA